MAFFLPVLTRAPVLGATVLLGTCLAVTGCSNSGSATAPALPPVSTTASAADAPTNGPAPGSSAPTSGPGVAATEQPGTGSGTDSGTGSGGTPRTTSNAQPTAPQGANLPLDTKLYPPPNVPRSAGTTPKKASYLKALQQGGLTVTASGATELTVGQAICDELGRGGNLDSMRKLLVPVGSAAASLSKSQLTGDQAADLYIASAKANLC